MMMTTIFLLVANMFRATNLRLTSSFDLFSVAPHPPLPPSPIFLATQMYDFSDVNLVRSVFKMCLYRKPEERIYTVDVVNTHVCHLSPNYRHGGHDNTQCRDCPCGSYEDNADLGLCLDGNSRTADTNWAVQKKHSCLTTFNDCSTCLCNHAVARSRDDPELAPRQLYEHLTAFDIPANSNPDHWPNGGFTRDIKEYEIINNDRQEASRGSVNNAWRR